WQNESGQKQQEVTFVDVTLWGRNAENAVQYLQKGRSVLVEGRLQLETWQDRESGQDRSKLKVVGDLIQFLGGGQERPAASGEGVCESQSTARPCDSARGDERDDRHERGRNVGRNESDGPVRRSGRHPEDRRTSPRQRVTS